MYGIVNIFSVEFNIDKNIINEPRRLKLSIKELAIYSNPTITLNCLYSYTLYYYILFST